MLKHLTLVTFLFCIVTIIDNLTRGILPSIKEICLLEEQKQILITRFKGEKKDR